MTTEFHIPGFAVEDVVETSPSYFILTAGGRWLRGVFGTTEPLGLPPGQPFVHYLPGRPHSRLISGSSVLWTNRSRTSSGAGRFRFLGSAVVTDIQCGTPGELTALYGSLPSAPPSVVYRLAADACGTLTAVVCQGWVSFARIVTPADAQRVGLRLSSGDRAFRGAVRIGAKQYEALRHFGLEGRGAL